jgi:hypothetical protein
LSLLQGSGAGPVSLAKRAGWCGATDLSAVGNAVGGDRLAQAGLGRTTGSRGVIYLPDIAYLYGDLL